MTTPFTSLPTWILSSAATRSHQVLQQRLSEAGLTGYEYRCIAVLTGDDQLSQAELGEAAALDPRDVTHTVRALEERGLVARAKDPNHGRRVLVSLTRSGHRTGKAVAGIMDDIQNAVFGRLSARERSTLLRLLERVG